MENRQSPAGFDNHTACEKSSLFLCCSGENQFAALACPRLGVGDRTKAKSAQKMKSNVNSDAAR